MGTTPNYFDTPVTDFSVIAAATTVYTTSSGTRIAPNAGSLVEVFSGSTTANRVIRRVDVKSQGVTVAGLVEFWVYDGTTYHIVEGFGVPVIARTPSTTLDPWAGSFEPRGGLFLPAAATALKLMAGLSVVQNGLSVTVHGAED